MQAVTTIYFITIVVLVLAIYSVVPVVAGSRGRSGIGWFAISIVLSPVIALILLVVLPNHRERNKIKRLARVEPRMQGLGVTRTTVKVDHSGAFEPDGVYSGVPYRIAHDGSVEAIMQGAKVRFRTMDSFLEAMA